MQARDAIMVQPMASPVLLLMATHALTVMPHARLNLSQALTVAILLLILLKSNVMALIMARNAAISARHA
jgi:hypothetical protein